MLDIMIADERSQIEIRETWADICKLCKEPDTNCALLPGVGFIMEGNSMPEVFWNLPFLLAYSVLDNVLTILRDQGAFTCTSWMLGEKMKASKAQYRGKTISWLSQVRMQGTTWHTKQ